ncbi:MAG: FAD-binding oxidoreductase [Chloroflexota bacterium]
MEAFQPRSSTADALDFEAFEASIHGSIILPGSAEYDEARLVHNANADRRPALIVRAADAADVAQTVTLARESGLELSIRGGGHSLAGYGTNDGGIVLDLGPMKGLHIDPERRLAWAQPGLTAGEYTVAAAAHGLATPFGDTGSVGISGLTLGGGIGWLVRKYGLAIDALVAVEIATGDGRVVTASEESHPDLFWAVRGGGGNFGVVTRFQFKLYPVGEILGGALFMPATRDVLRGLVPIAAAAPEELSTISFLMALPPAPFIPAELVGTTSLVIMFVWAGDPADGQAALQPFRDLATPLADMAMPMPYPGIYEMLRDAEQRSLGVHRSRFLSTLDDDAVDAILEAVAAPSSPGAMIQLRVLGGAMARIPATDTAFAHRDAAVMATIMTLYDDPSTEAAHVAWTVGLHEKLAPNSVGVYSNFLEAEGDERIRAAYPAGTYERLAEVKRRYDPSNLFHLNQNIRPAARG